MTLFAKLTGYTLLIRLVFAGILWLVVPNVINPQVVVLVVGSFVLVSAIDLVYVHFLLRPLQVLVNRKLHVIQEVGTIDFSPLATTTLELSQLDEHINGLRKRLLVRFECEKAFTAYASHELLTPIAVLRNSFDNLIADKHTSQHTATRLVESQKTLLRLSRIVQTLLRLARIENHQYLKNEVVSIRDVLQEVLYDLDDRITLKNINVALLIDEDILMDKANRSLIHTMLLSLVGNAVRHNTDKGQLVIRRSQIGNVPTLTIRDDGLGMTDEQVAALTEYGHPNKSSGQSTGIGLQLILTIATFHHIEVNVDSPLPPGTRITLVFA